MPKFVRYAERANQNEEAIPFIRQRLQNKSRRIAVLVAWMYVEIRLLTLISHALRPTKVETSEIQTFLEEQRLGKRTIIWARKLRTISSKQKGELTRLANLRNDIAHKRKTWITNPDVTRRRDMEQACKNAIQFLKDTVGDPR